MLLQPLRCAKFRQAWFEKLAFVSVDDASREENWCLRAF